MTVEATRTRRWFWSLTVVAILAAGALSRALLADPGALTGLQVAGSGLVLATSGALATRVLLALSREPRRPRWLDRPDRRRTG
jgi:hypothetical protein